MALPPLRQEITADVTGLTRGLASAQRAIRAFALAGAAALGTATGALTVMTARSMQNIDAQAKLARSLGTTTQSVQILARAGDLAGVSMSGIEQATKDLTRRLSQAADGSGPAADALERLGLTAQELADIPLDQRVGRINEAIDRFIPAAQRAAVAGQLFGEEGSIAISRIDTETLRQATQDIQNFGVAVSETDAQQIQVTNDALSRMALIFEGMANQLAVAVSPALEQFANRFAEMAEAGGPLREALDRVVEAASGLMDVLSQQATIDAFAGAISGMIELFTGAANAIVGITQNLEAFTAVASGAAIALAALGGPITAVVIATGAALAGLATLRRRQAGLVDTANSAAEAEAALAAAIDGVADALPGANADTVRRYQELEVQARSALAAAEAELTLAAAMVESTRASVLGASGFNGVSAESNPAMPGLREELEIAGAAADEAAERVGRLQEQVANTSRTVQALLVGGSGGGGSQQPYTLDPITFDDGEGGATGDESTGGGGGGGGGMIGELEGRLDALLQSLNTEREILQAWYDESQATLEDALAQRLITEQEYLEARTRLEQEYAERSKQIEGMRQQNSLQTFTSGMNDILSAAAQGNEGLMRVQKIFAAGMAWIDTLQGAARELRAGTFGFASAAAVIAKGISFIAAINSTSTTSRAGVGGGAQVAAAPAPRPTQNVLIDLVGASSMQVNQFQQFADTFNEAQRQGLMANVVVRGV